MNSSFPSFKNSHFQNEAKCKTFVVKMSFISISMTLHLDSLSNRGLQQLGNGLLK